MKSLGRILALMGACALALAAQPANIAELKRAFEKPPDEARMMMRWWWFGPAVTKPQLEREMRLMKEGGIGGFEVQPVYPLELEGNYKYLSPEFLDALTFTGAKARELGLRMDLTLGSGWPFGGPHITVEHAAARLRVDRSAQPKLAEGEKLIASVPSGGVTLHFIAGRTRQTVKRPSAGAEGWVLDHYSLPALQNHLKTVGEPMLRALAKTPPYAVFSDSLEVYNNDWTDDFLAEFRKRRGYDLVPYLPALAGDIGDKTAAIRHDWGQTLSELADERYLVPARRWAEQHGTRFRSQTYGIPPVTLSSGKLVDLNEGEGSHWRRFSTSRWASSSSHLYGKPVTSSETWTWLHSPVFRATPLDMKAEADLHFIQGINQLIGHGWPYSPPEAGEPGWRFYAAAVFNHHNPWWNVMPDVAAYMQRVSYLMREGQPANDVALHLPTHDAFASFTLGRASVNQAMENLLGPNVMPQILDAGYNLDFIDDRAIADRGITHPILVLPNVERIPLATLEKINEYARKGGKVIATRRLPSLAPGLMEAETVTPKIREAARSIRLLADETKLGDALHELLPADLAAPAGIGFIHRKLPFADVYFLANTTNQPLRGTAAFRIQGTQSAWWDAFTGKFAAAGGSRLELDLAPYESRVVVFSRDRLAPPVAPSGTAPSPVDLGGDWRVTFAGSQPVTMSKLTSWTDDKTREFYSGQATYEKTITVPDWKGRQVFLNFGEGTPEMAQQRRAGNGMRAMLEGPVREAAVVYVNGQRAGSVWCAPYEVNITPMLKPGQNAIRVVVANTAVNLLAKGPLPDYKALTAKYGERFQAQDMNAIRPLPSGLLGPVRLIAR
jgi:hypothetical protein